MRERCMFKKVVTLAAMVFFTVPLFAKDFTAENMFLSFAKLKTDYDYEKYGEGLTIGFRRDVWNKYRNDEFEINDKIAETIAMVKKRVSEFSLDGEYTIHTTFRFEDYDFTNEMFPLDSLTKESYYHPDGSAFSGRLIEWHGTETTNFYVFFENTDVIGNLDMPKDIAKQFLQSRKRGSNVYRKVPAQLKFKIVKLGDEDSVLIAKLTSVEIYDDENFKKLIKKSL